MKDKKEITIFYAVSKTGQGRVFINRPERNEHFGIWMGEHIGFISSLFMWAESEGLELPDIRWKDDPVPMKVSIGF